MNSTGSVRLAIILSHPNQYYSPWFRWLRVHTPLVFRVFYLWEAGVAERRDPGFGRPVKWDVDLLSGYDSEFVPNKAKRPGMDHFWGLRNPSLGARLKSWGPTAILLYGYNSYGLLRAIAWAMSHRVPLLFRGDSHFLGREEPAPLRRMLLERLYGRFAACIYVGEANRRYFAALGVPASRLFFAPHAVDGSLYEPLDPGHAARASELRTGLDLAPETRIVLFAGKLVPAKQPRELLAAFLELAPARTALVFVGEGEDKKALQDEAQARGSAGTASVHFLPFANQTEMPSRYLLADLFVLPSRGTYETWGLAVNEAMRMNVPCLVSDRVGCQADLVSEGETGWVFKAEEPGALKASLAAALGVLADPEKRDAIRMAVAARIARYSYAQATEGLMAALASLPSR